MYKIVLCVFFLYLLLVFAIYYQLTKLKKKLAKKLNKSKKSLYYLKNITFYHILLHYWQFIAN